MSRRKQSKPRQIKRSLGDLNGSEDPSDDVSMSGEDGGASDQEDSAECDGSSPSSFPPLYNEEPRTHESLAAPDECEEDEKGLLHCSEEEEEEETEGEAEPHWNGPDDLMLSGAADDLKVLALRDLPADTVWGPFSGSVQSEEPTERSFMSLECEDADYWLRRIPVTSRPTASNCTIYSQGGALFCKLTQDLPSGNALVARLSFSTADQSKAIQTGAIRLKEEPEYPAALHSEIQLLPQQAGMAAILATAVVNKDIFPCKDCGIWYRSERNLQAHLMYYCASRQKQQTASSPPQDKPKDSYPNERLCPFPQCNKSCPSTSSLEIHMRTHSGERPFVCLICLSAFTTKANCERHLKVHTDSLNGVCHGCGFISTTRDILYSHLVTSHMVCQPGSHSEGHSPKQPTGLSPGDSGIVLKCQVCGYSAETPALLQQHVHTHLEVRVPAERSPTPRQSSPPSSKLPDPLDGEPAACMSRPDSSSPGANGSSASHGCSPLNQLNIKEEPRSDYETDSKEEESLGSPQGNAVRRSLSPSTSPKSPSVVAVKAEPTSPTPGSSPVHPGTAGSVLPGGAMFLPQYVFSSEAAIMPQASEILAKMSEMVHSRIKQGQGAAAGPQAFYTPGSPASVHKGATCFECDINFNNINNFYVHKRLYCSSRHQQGEAAGVLKEGATATAAPPTAHATSPQARPVSRTASASPSYSDPAPGGTASEPKTVEVKSEEPGMKDATCSSSSEGEGPGGGQASEGSQSPSGSAEDQEDELTRTFCQACNIRFSRHENYIVHKRFYCASRHDPSKQRTHSGKTPFLPQPIRTRKRKKMYEIHMAQSEALANTAALTAATGLGVKQEVTSVPPHSKVSVTSSPEGDGPIDLSKRPRLREDPRGTSVPAVPLTDYHKCTACSISFNSIENYLAHKTYYCPATTLQPQTLEQLSRLKRPASTSPKSRGWDLHPDAKIGKTAVVANPSESTPLNAAHGVKTPRTPPVVCPYCPPNRQLTCDLVEHFKMAHGLVITLQQHPETHSAGVSPSPSLSPREAAPLTPPKPSPRPHRDSVNGRSIKLEVTSPSSSVLNGNPLDQKSVGASTTDLSPARVHLTVSPVPEAGQLGHTLIPTLVPEKAALLLSHAHTAPAMPTTPLASPLQNGNTRYCRLCNIKFSSLSNFIAHKKYYCSSHSAEHVK
ncbi:zinc finger protein ZFPM1 isoform X2 [Triplophysa dalaica]|uniref:zinc finger protein ZFPM1 isoform X2 n=1 Tax=Triplophysa dalaica TaxID=1582913 RepID=UPI0024E02C51|nr:zinc finger protein ZFPM1 isoform X2 [Triplophysa dalaica]